ncbi:Actin- protein 8 [Branchiostoma belcheri]|nr:Actin- protein 8 [Branchiostoma belcheri]
MAEDVPSNAVPKASRPANNDANHSLQPRAVTSLKQDNETASTTVSEHNENNPCIQPYAVAYQEHDGTVVKSANCDVVQPYAVKYQKGEDTVIESANVDDDPSMQLSADRHQGDEGASSGNVNCDVIQPYAVKYQENDDIFSNDLHTTRGSASKNRHTAPDDEDIQPYAVAYVDQDDVACRTSSGGTQMASNRDDDVSTNPFVNNDPNVPNQMNVPNVQQPQCRRIRPCEGKLSKQRLQPVQGTSVIVLHPGSSFLRASDTFPHVIPQVIVARRRCCKPDTAGKHEDRTLLRHEACQAESRAVHEQGLRGVQQALLSIITSSGQHRLAPPTEQLAAYNAQVGPQIEDTSDLEWADTSSKPQFLVGQEVLYLHPSESYNVHWPMSGTGGSLTAVLADLETIWTTAIEKFLDIPVKDLKESVCATFGSGVASACVVDVGDQKTAVCCVEDGLSHRNSRLWLDYGGRDVTRSLEWLLRKTNFPYKDCNLLDRLDCQLLQELKHNSCHLNKDQFGARLQDVHVQRPDTFTRRYQIRVGEETIQAPIGLFYPQLFGLVGGSLVAKAVAEKKAKASSKHGGEGDKTSSDAKPSLEPRHKAREEAGGSEAKHRRGADRLPSASRRGSEPAPLKLMGVDQAILHIPGAQNFLLHRVRSQLPAKYRNIADTMEVITRPKDQDPQMVCWKGAAVLACLDTTQELWVGQREWRKFGIRILRERSPFVW